MPYVNPQPKTINIYEPNGTGTYSITFQYELDTDVWVGVYNIDNQKFERVLKDDATYPWILETATTVKFTNGDPGNKVIIYRSTDINDLIAEFYAGSAIRAQDLNDNFDQLLFASQELTDGLSQINSDFDDIKDDLGDLGDIISNSLQYEPVANVAELNAKAATDPDNLKGYEIQDSTDIDTLASPIIVGLPPTAGGDVGEDPVNGVYWNDGIVTRVQWQKSSQNWRFNFYYAKNGDNRYQQQTLAAPITPNPSDYKDGTLWFDSGDANLYVLYNDGESRQWVITNPLSAYGQIVTSDDVFWSRFAGENRVYPKNSSDSVGNDSAGSNWEIKADGSAKFEGVGPDYAYQHKLINTSSSQFAGVLRIEGSGGDDQQLISASSGNQVFGVQGDGSATFEGNVGIGGTEVPLVNGVFKAIDIGYQGSGVTGRNGNPTIALTSNLYNDGTVWRYGEGNTSAGALSVGGDQLYFESAGVGTSGEIATLSEKFRIEPSGTATFKGVVRITTETGSPVSGAAKGVEINPSGRITCAKASGNTENDQVFSGFAVGNVNATTKIFSDGSAEFAGGLIDLASNGTVSTSRPDRNVYANLNAYDGGNGDKYIIVGGSQDTDGTNRVTKFSVKNDGSATFKGDISIEDSSYIRVRRAGDNTSNAIELAPDGMVTVNGMASPGTGVVGCKLTPTGGLLVTTDGIPVFRGYSLNSVTPTSQINADGTATFKNSLRVSGIDVGERLEKADNALQALKTAVATATDFTTLKAAIISSLQEV